MNTYEFLSIAHAIVPDRTAAIFKDTRFSYLELENRVGKLTSGLRNLGIRKGDRIACMNVNSNHVIEAYFASAILGAIFVPINYRSRSQELQHMLKISDPSVLIVGQRYINIVENLEGEDVLPDHLISISDSDRQGWTQYENIISACSVQEENEPQGEDEDTVLLMFTSGTTGAPKAVMLSHQSFTSYMLANVSPPDPEVEERNLISVPLYHIAGIQSVMAAVYGGRTMVVQPQFEPLEWMQLVEREQASRTMMVPTMLKQLMDHPRFLDYDLSSLEIITYGAAPMPLEVIRRAIREFPNARFINAFGQTETASTITMLSTDDHVLRGTEKEIEQKLHRLGSIGKPLEDVEVAIVDHEGIPLPSNTVGEIVARGPRITKGYWGDQEKSEEVLKNGWLYTGDLGYQDGYGYIYLQGRAKDFIKRGGEMVSPGEVEQILVSHPDIEDAAVIGVPDVEWGERVVAVVVSRGNMVGEDELIEYCRKSLASFKSPESITFISELPRNSLGKVLKTVLRQEHG